MSLSESLVNLAKALFKHKSDANGHNLATQSKAGFMSPLDKSKLDSLDSSGSSGSNYAECSTASATLAKTVDCDGFVLEKGASITIKFTVTNSVAGTTTAPLTLDVNSTGAKSIIYNGSTAISSGFLTINRVLTFTYDGTYWAITGNLDTNTKYSVMTAATSSAAGTSGLVPAPAAGKQTSFLRGDGTWQTVSAANITNASITMNKLVDDLDCGEI
jgi:hypothetical protein